MINLPRAEESRGFSAMRAREGLEREMVVVEMAEGLWRVMMKEERK